MWIVQYALNHKYTMGVLAILIVLFGVLSAKRMSTDILPEVDIPSVNVIWTYSGLTPAQMSAMITSFSETSILNNVDNVREVRSETLNGIAIVRVEFQPTVEIEVALAQITAISQTIQRRMPAGVTPPLVVQQRQSSTPILQLVLSSDTLTDGALFDYARLQLRSQIQSIPGMRLTLPYGGAARQVMIDLDPARLAAYNMTAADVVAAVGRQSPTLPSGALREGGRELQISVNASPEAIAEFADLPIANENGRVVYLRDVASVRDGEALQTNIARFNGNNAAILSVIKLGDASTVEIVRAIKARLPTILASAPEGVRIDAVFDQSTFVENALATLRFETILVGLLVAAVVFIFLGSWRSSFIVLSSIPLALLASVIGLQLLGYTFNVMTLGGLALVIGILVDNALVEIENVNRNLDMGKPVRQAIMDGAQQIVFPEFVSTCAICIVFMPMLLLSGVSAFVFAPLALAVIFAMVASFLLSRTVVPTMALMLLPAERTPEARASQSFIRRLNHRVEHGLDRLKDKQHALLEALLERRRFVLIPALLVVAGSAALAMNLGRDYFPRSDAGFIRLQVRADPGLRLEDTGRLFGDVQREVRALIPPSSLQGLTEIIGVHDPINLGWVESAVVGSFEGEMLIQLAPGHAGTEKTLRAIRQMMREKFPQLQFFARPSDATSMTLAGSAVADFEVRFVGRDVPGNLALARELMEKLRAVKGATDVTLRQVLNLPEYHIAIDRTRAAQLGIDADRATRTLLSALGSGGSVAPIYWADMRTGSSNTVQIQAPPIKLEGIQTLLNLKVGRTPQGGPVTLAAIATVTPRTAPASLGRATLQPTLSVLANVEGADLGAVLTPLKKIVAELEPRLRAANRIDIRGQAQSMELAYSELAGGLALAAILVFLVLVINFQSWSLPIIAMSGLPIAVSGAVCALWITGTSLSVPALMGLLMVIGVSTANSVLVTSFARDRMVEGATSLQAALEAAATRMRPVLMTATAMIIGLVPMALGLGEGGEQNSPLGRAVIGGLVFGTVATLFLVPIVCAVFGRVNRSAAASQKSGSVEPDATPAAVPSGDD